MDKSKLGKRVSWVRIDKRRSRRSAIRAEEREVERMKSIHTLGAREVTRPDFINARWRVEGV